VPPYPLLLDLTARLVVVVGGGAVAARRVIALAEAGARVVVVAPVVLDAVREHAEVREKPYAAGDLDGAWLVHAATDDPAVNAAVAADADAAGIWCVRADDHAATAARVPASTVSGDVVVSVGTEGADPRRAVLLRDAIRLLLDAGELPLRHRREHTGHVTLVGGGPSPRPTSWSSTSWRRGRGWSRCPTTWRSSTRARPRTPTTSPRTRSTRCWWSGRWPASTSSA
jgi:uroporphyrin-III C-methyltransferase/precorrin-2 dehydrogenase/sirohydrochlorin ferrochelatase